MDAKEHEEREDKSQMQEGSLSLRIVIVKMKMGGWGCYWQSWKTVAGIEGNSSII